jgi:hypothetical protein
MPFRLFGNIEGNAEKIIFLVKNFCGVCFFFNFVHLSTYNIITHKTHEKFCYNFGIFTRLYCCVC